MPEETKKPEAERLCPDCGKEVAADAARCPHCDFPIRAHLDLERVRSLREKQNPRKSGSASNSIFDIF